VRPLRIKPAHPITRLALSPDGRQLAVGQGYPTRVFDTLDGRELSRHPITWREVQQSPTSRYELHAADWELRFAEVAAGRAWVNFQTGWRRGDGTNYPPAEPATLPLAWPGPSTNAPTIYQSVPNLLERMALPERWFYMQLFALSGDHRLAVGRPNGNGSPAVFDLAREQILVALRWPDVPKPHYEIRAVFGPGGRVFAGGLREVFVYDLPPLPEPDAPRPRPPEPPRRSLLRRISGAFVQRGRRTPEPPRRRSSIPPTRSRSRSRSRTRTSRRSRCCRAGRG